MYENKKGNNTKNWWNDLECMDVCWNSIDNLLHFGSLIEFSLKLSQSGRRRGFVKYVSKMKAMKRERERLKKRLKTINWGSLAINCISFFALRKNNPTFHNSAATQRNGMTHKRNIQKLHDSLRQSHEENRINSKSKAWKKFSFFYRSSCGIIFNFYVHKHEVSLFAVYIHFL